MAFANQDKPSAADIPGEKILVNGRYEILMGMGLSQVAAGGGPVYAARLKNDAQMDYIAILCNSGWPVRSDLLSSMRVINNPHLLRPVDGAVVDPGIDGNRCYALIYERPAGPLCMRTLTDTRPAMTEEALFRQVLQPLGRALGDLEHAGQFHGAIRPTNLYARDGGTGWQLGECLSLPAGLGQPALFESLERAQCRPAGRGAGQSGDDLFALGATALFMLLGRNPVPSLEDGALIQQRLERGTFYVYVGNHKISGNYVEMLRGLLADDPRQRWTADDLIQWLDGRRFAPKGGEGMKRAARSFHFAGKDYATPRLLAHGFSQNPPAAVPVLEGAEIDRWLRRSLGDETRAEILKEVLTEVREQKGPHPEDRLTARVSIILDPYAPLRYRGLSLMPAGMPTALCEAMLGQAQPQPIAEAIGLNLVARWHEELPDLKAETLPAVQAVEKAKTWIDKSVIGQGLERALYELNPTLPCISPLIRSAYATNAREVLVALDRLWNRSDRPREPIDRHIAAFLLARDRRTSDALLAVLSGDENNPRRIIALLTVLTQAQFRHGPESLPGLCAWFVQLAEPAIKRYHYKPAQEEMRRDAKEKIEQGDLEKILQLLDDPKSIDRDDNSFNAARLLFAARARKIAELKMQNADPEGLARRSGWPAAISMAMVIAACLLLGALFQAMR